MQMHILGLFPALLNVWGSWIECVISLPGIIVIPKQAHGIFRWNFLAIEFLLLCLPSSYCRIPFQHQSSLHNTQSLMPSMRQGNTSCFNRYIPQILWLNTVVVSSHIKFQCSVSSHTAFPKVVIKHPDSSHLVAALSSRYSSQSSLPGCPPSQPARRGIWRPIVEVFMSQA